MSDLSAFINQLSSQSRQPQPQRSQLDAAMRDIAARSADTGRSRANDEASFRRLIQSANERAADEKAASERAERSRDTAKADKNGRVDGDKASGEVKVSQAIINKLSGQLNGDDSEKSEQSLKALLAKLEEETSGKAQGLLKQLLALARKGDSDTSNAVQQLLESLAPGNSGDKKQALGEKLAAIAEKINQALNEGKGESDTELSAEKLKQLLSEESELSAEGIPGLLATNLSPQELSTLSETLQGKQGSDNQLKGILQSLVNLKGGSSQGNNQDIQSLIANALNKQANNSSQQDGESGNTQNTKSIAARLNALLGNAGNGQQQGQQFSLDLADLPPGPKQLAQSRLDFLQYGQGSQSNGLTQAQNTNGNAAQMLMNAMGIGAGAGKNAANAGNTAESNGKAGAFAKSGMMLAAGQAKGLTPLSGLMQGGDVGLNTQFDQLTDWMMQFGGPSSGANSGQGSSGTMALFATAQSTGAQHATQQHSSTQMVAATLQKHAGRGGQGARNLTLQMEPPDLGRLKIRMDMGSDNQLRTHLTVEKPETLMLLQRDGHTLERALQQAGIDTSKEESLSFELAQDDSAFAQNNDGGGNNGDGQTGNNASNAGDGEDDEVIETDMTWTIDPETGIQHYDILA